ncbi:MAG: head GIN domain-containing protein [Prolixibacteraceae bacterium]
MKTIKLFTLLLICITLVQTYSVSASQADGNRQKRNITGFHGVSVSTGIDLYLSQKNSEEVYVEADEDDLDKIITRVEGGILKIYIKEKSFFSFDWNSSPRKVYVSFINLDKLEASAGSDARSEGVLKLDRLNLDASSGSDIKLELEVNELDVHSSSGSDISLKGKTNTIQANASSGSDINAGELTSKKCTASVSSGSDIRVNVTDELNANASSGGDISYSGNPARKDINESSGGDVHGR